MLHCLGCICHTQRKTGYVWPQDPPSRGQLAFAFCTALCWFNPFLWIAMRKSAEDLELSCDELIFGSHEPESIVFSGSDRVEDNITHRNRKCLDEAALYEYFASLTLDKITGGSSYPVRRRRECPAPHTIRSPRVILSEAKNLPLTAHNKPLHTHI